MMIVHQQVYNQLGHRADGSLVNAGWIRNLGTSVTRAVSYDPELGGQLMAVPVPEIATLRTSVLATVAKATPLPPAGKPMTLVADGASAVDIELVVAASAASDTSSSVSSACGASVTVLGGAATVVLSRPADLRRPATIAITGGGRNLCKGSFPLPAKLKALSLRVLVDGAVVEAFAAGGRGVCSVGVQAAAGPTAVLVAAAGGGGLDDAAATTMLNATVHNMSAI
eukprot:COSAG04_NODE_265_length_18593_cov_4.226776_15_plen_226_part_00